MTLTEMLTAVRQLSIMEKLKLIRILAEDLETAEDISPLEPFKTYYLPHIPHFEVSHSGINLTSL